MPAVVGDCCRQMGVGGGYRRLDCGENARPGVWPRRLEQLRKKGIPRGEGAAGEIDRIGEGDGEVRAYSAGIDCRRRFNHVSSATRPCSMLDGRRVSGRVS